METVKVNEPTISQATESMFGKHCTTNIPPLACNAMAALARHLEEFSLHSLLSVDPVIRPLSNRNEVLLSPNALEQLEILQSTEVSSERIHRVSEC